MCIKVAKFGGSSVADAKQFQKVRDIIQADSKRRYIVPSAPGKRHAEDYKITDLLYLCHEHVQHSVPFDQMFDMICDRYLGIIDELNLSIDLEPYLIDIKQKISEGASVDYTASRGEYLNGLILAHLLDYDFVDPKDIILFDKYGSLDAEKTKELVSKRLMEHERAVIPGFYGAMPNGEIKTFSRGGSDITGSIIAQAVGAEVYENWTDVSGFLMADPRIVKNPKQIEKITYHELRELSYMGATVLHEESVFPVREAGIPINVRNTNEPDNKGTIIVSNKEFINPGTITGVAGRKDFTVIAIQKNRMHSDISFIRKILSILEANNVPVEHLPSGIDNISIVIADSNLGNKLNKLLKEINEQCSPDCIEVYPNMALIATVGQGMVYTRGVAARLFTALAEAGINIRMIDQGSSEINIIVGVETNDFEKAVQAIYHGFVE
ncbi:aspartate kinase [Crassaminicella thermophila]|uniref:Aspartokinase n=1 Tax=Crassaminicella thermophila TaxID=2599308 RepID=A0A5C0SB98_CRATE|nr:aspartate kinase [Crassaminicella thermophila]QEK11370.1 aspartate kinase [Crassaminicella thermophila]